MGVTSEVAETLKIAIDRRPHTEALLDGVLAPPRGLDVEFVEVRPINRAFRRMLRDDEFDISEMAVGTHFISRAHGAPYVALPVFLARHYPHHAVQVRRGLASPRDLAGGRIGSRSYTMTTALWARGAMQQQLGVDLRSVTWVVADEEHVLDTAMPDNVSFLPGADLQRMLADGDLDGGIALHADVDDARPAWTDPAAAEQDWFARTGAEPVNHTLVVKKSLADRDAGLVRDVYAWFVEAARLGAPGDGRGQAAADVAGGYGLTERNHASLSTLLELTRQQLPGEASALPDSVEGCFLDLEA